MDGSVCQFFIRGRCQRENCEFKHEKPVASKTNQDASTAPDAKEDPAINDNAEELKEQTGEDTIPVVARKVNKELCTLLDSNVLNQALFFFFRVFLLLLKKLI